MGIFHDLVEAVNRTSKPLTIRYDGQDMVLEPNYDEVGDPIEGVRNMIPRVVIPYALNQCVLMGSERLRNPSAFTSLVGIIDSKKKQKHSWHETGFIEDAVVEEHPTRVAFDAVMEDDPTIKGYKIKGRKVPLAEDAEMGMTTTPFDVVPK